MKKIIGITLIIALIAMFGSVISFFVFDFGGFIDAQSRWQRKVGSRIISNAGEIISDITIDRITDGIDEHADYMEQSIQQFADAIEKSANELTEDLLSHDLPFSKLADNFYSVIFQDMEVENGYMTEKGIKKSKDPLLDKWTQSPENIEEILLDINNINIVLGKTQGQNMEFYLTGKEGTNSNIVFSDDISDGKYKIKDEPDRFSVSIHIGRRSNHQILYILLPDGYTGKVKADILNGNFVAIKPRNHTEIKITNGNIIVAEGLYHDFSGEMTNGNIIMDITKDLDAKLKASVDRGLVIGFGKADSKKGYGSKWEKTYGNGKYKINLNIVNGNIIGH